MNRLKILPILALAFVAAFARPQVGDRFAVTVYCGATDRADAKYAAAARELGAGIARRGWTLVWGGSKTGLMGAVARGAKENGGRVVGVLPEFIQKWEVAYPEADEMIIVSTMAERKLILMARSDVYVVLPGGLGTLDELAEVLDLRQLERHHKPVILLNQDGYYDELLSFLNRGVTEHFIKVDSRRLLQITPTIAGVLRLLEESAAGSNSPKAP